MSRHTWLSRGISVSLACWCLGAGAAQLSASVAQNDLIYGQSLTMTVRAENRGAVLQGIDLDPLREDFQVETSAASDTDGDGTIDTLRIKLRPRRTGEFTIPSLSLAGARSEPLPLHVAAASDGGQPLRVDSRVSASSVWVRQQLLVTVHVRSTNRFFELQAPSFDQPGLTVVPLQTETDNESIAGTDYTVKTTGWALYPAHSGAMLLNLPPVDYSRGGRIQARFAVPRVRVDVRALPPYIPADMPVGAVRLTTRLDAPALLNTDSIAFWKVTTSASNLPVAALPSALARLRDSADLEFIPATPVWGQQTTVDGVHSSRTVTIPFVAGGSGRIPLPILRLQYFDPDTGRLVRVATQAQSVWVLGTGWRISLSAICLAALLYGATHTWRVVRAAHARSKRERALLREIRAAGRASEVRRALQHFGHDQGWRLNGSLQTWLLRFTQHYRSVDPRLEQNLVTLNRLEFAAEQRGDLDEVRARVVAALQKARPRRRV